MRTHSSRFPGSELEVPSLEQGMGQSARTRKVKMVACIGTSSFILLQRVEEQERNSKKLAAVTQAIASRDGRLLGSELRVSQESLNISEMRNC